MTDREIDLLKVKGKNIEAFIKDNEDDIKFGEKLLYMGCLDAVKKIKLSKITEEHVKGPIKVFLVNWGIMLRVLANRKQKAKGVKSALDSCLTRKRGPCYISPAKIK